MLRNLNQRSSGRRICGTSHIGIKGSLIPAGSAIRNLDTPADDNKEYKLRLLTWPASGSLFMYEDGTSVFTPTVDGTFTATGQIAENGIDIGSPVTITYQSGVASTTVACSVGAASATGSTASVQQDATISCAVGAASAAGASASAQTNVTIGCAVGSAAATGQAASVSSNVTISCATGNAVASGQVASIAGSVTVSCGVGVATAGGSVATVSSTATGSTIACGFGAAGASGAAASIYQGMMIGALVGNASATGASASIRMNQTYARAPAGNGYTPQRDERQSRPAQVQRNMR